MAVIGVVGMGEMGAGIGLALQESGARVVTTLAGRSEASRRRAEAAGVEPLESLADVVAQADLFLSIVPPTVAVDLANEVTAAVAAVGRGPLLYGECNAIAPHTLAEIERSGTGLRIADLAIMGPAPTSHGTPPYMPGSGAAVADVVAVTGAALAIDDIGGEVGRASALKMCYAALTKGGTALHVELLTAAERLGVRGELWSYLQRRTPNQVEIIEKALPTMVPKAARWVGEMEEIAATFADRGLTPLMLEGAAEMYRLVSAAYGDSPRKDTVEALVQRVAAEVDVPAS